MGRRIAGDAVAFAPGPGGGFSRSGAWIFLDFLGLAWFLLVSRFGFLWIFLDFVGFPWLHIETFQRVTIHRWGISHPFSPPRPRRPPCGESDHEPSKAHRSEGCGMETATPAFCACNAHRECSSFLQSSARRAAPCRRVAEWLIETAAAYENACRAGFPQSLRCTSPPLATARTPSHDGSVRSESAPSRAAEISATKEPSAARPSEANRRWLRGPATTLTELLSFTVADPSHEFDLRHAS